MKWWWGNLLQLFSKEALGVTLFDVINYAPPAEFELAVLLYI